MKKRTDNFQQFANKKKGAAIKEAMRQEKRKVKAEARAAGEAMRQLKKDKARGLVPLEPTRPAPVGKGKLPPPSATEKNKFSDKKTTAPAGAKEKAFAGKEKKFTGKPNGRSTTTAAGEMTAPKAEKALAEQMPLNKFIAHAGVCARREAAELVKTGKVTVNGDIVYEPGYKVSAKDKVKVKGKAVFLQRNAVYILLNKPKDFITTASDPQGRKTVVDLVRAATPERVFPIGRLDRNTTGVLILTNDGELTQQLSHPSYEVRKVYEITLETAVSKNHLEQILAGITLEDGFVKADAVGYVDGQSKNVIGIEIHSGKNRIVRRIFEHFGYEVKALDRVLFANLTKKNVERGKWRFLQEKEVRLLKHMNKGFVRKKPQSPHHGD
ncbi:MAG: rRNA pseudouridine synthase [Sphingobacteriia bacterium]|nr:MAG: rRNA pseudouridine synthase [Sphingobacteriia bacterium]